MDSSCDFSQVKPEGLFRLDPNLTQECSEEYSHAYCQCLYQTSFLAFFAVWHTGKSAVVCTLDALQTQIFTCLCCCVPGDQLWPCCSSLNNSLSQTLVPQHSTAQCICQINASIISPSCLRECSIHQIISSQRCRWLSAEALTQTKDNASSLSTRGPKMGIQLQPALGAPASQGTAWVVQRAAWNGEHLLPVVGEPSRSFGGNH